MTIKQMARALENLGRFDANETAIFSRALEHVKAEIVDAEYPAFRAREFVPQDSGVDPGAETFTWYSYDRVGLARMIDSYATDLPNVTEYGSPNMTPIRSVGQAYSYDLQEVRRAAKAGYALETRRGKIAREAIERKIDHIVALGDSTRGLPGMANNSNVSLLTAGINGDWDGLATSEEILEDLHNLATSVWEQSKHVHEATDILLGTSLYKTVSTRSYSSTIPDSILSVFRRSRQESGKPINVNAWTMLDLADAEGNGPRAVAYEKNPLNLEAVIPIDFESLPPQATSLHFTVPCHARVGGTVIYRPLSLVYCDALNDA